ncbi:MAG: hypothetical protein QXO51_02360 [Halobacteria archaeon]
MANRELNKEILRLWFERQLTVGARYLDDQVAHLYSGAMGAIVNPFVVVFYRFMQRERVLNRARRQLSILLGATDDVEQGLSVDAALDRWTGELLRTEELYVRCDRDHPDFPKVLPFVREAWRGRLDSLVRMVRAEGHSFDDLMRNSFSRAEAEEFWNIQYRVLERLLDLAEQSEMLRVPKIIRKEVVGVMRAGYAWYRQWMTEEIRRIYREAGGATAAAKAESEGAA